MDAVRCFVDQQQDSWDEHLAQLAGALRASVNRSTGYTPNKLMLGRETNQPAELMFGTTEDHKYTGTEEYIIGLEKAMKTSHEIAWKTLKTTQARMKKDYDLRVLERQYAPGDLVGPDTGETMIQCDQCKEWFHLTCVGISVSEVDEINIYTCPNCSLIDRQLPPVTTGT
ncbi:Hypothetical predicted protein [Mytilus galloprovincialis]|uniref:Zinc finger PHD-type domain-containing protein n=1 Tax=Mytilus galloprovincialis TaxID=29158 RepID=A0A8B6E1S6_MYTGA|nr:Hypothetical predicted protein [Mytilus galloprovincialis]